MVEEPSNLKMDKKLWEIFQEKSIVEHSWEHWDQKELEDLHSLMKRMTWRLKLSLEKSKRKPVIILQETFITKESQHANLMELTVDISISTMLDIGMEGHSLLSKLNFKRILLNQTLEIDKIYNSFEMDTLKKLKFKRKG